MLLDGKIYVSALAPTDPAVVFSVLSALTIGLPFLTGVLFLARGTIRYFRVPARRLLGWDWASPPRRTARRIPSWRLV